MEIIFLLIDQHCRHIESPASPVCLEIYLHLLQIFVKLPTSTAGKYTQTRSDELVRQRNGSCHNLVDAGTRRFYARILKDTPAFMALQYGPGEGLLGNGVDVRMSHI